MINPTRFKAVLSLWVLILIAGFILFANCDSKDTVTENETPIDITGSWELETTITSNTCDLPNGEPETDIIYLGPETLEYLGNQLISFEYIDE